MHDIHTRFVGRSPWGWRDAVVTGNTGEDPRELDLEYVVGDGVRVWHHDVLLGVELHPGSLVRVREGLHALDTVGSGWVNIDLISGGLGPVPEPEHPELWVAEHQVAITDVAAGRGLTDPGLRGSGRSDS